jgi:hypothetical protein
MSFFQSDTFYKFFPVSLHVSSRRIIRGRNYRMYGISVVKHGLSSDLHHPVLDNFRSREFVDTLLFVLRLLKYLRHYLETKIRFCAYVEPNSTNIYWNEMCGVRGCKEKRKAPTTNFV